MKGRQLITDAEIAQINAYQGYKPLLPLAWAMTEVESAVYGVPFSERPIFRINVEGGTKITDIERHRVHDILSNFNQLIFTFRGHCGFITNWIAMPEPFPYYHAVTFASTMYMLILTWCFTTLHYPAVLTFFSYLTMNICVLGLKEVCGSPLPAPHRSMPSSLPLSHSLTSHRISASSALRPHRESDT